MKSFLFHSQLLLNPNHLAPLGFAYKTSFGFPTRSIAIASAALISLLPRSLLPYFQPWRAFTDSVVYRLIILSRLFLSFAALRVLFSSVVSFSGSCTRESGFSALEVLLRWTVWYRFRWVFEAGVGGGSFSHLIVLTAEKGESLDGREGREDTSD